MKRFVLAIGALAIVLSPACRRARERAFERQAREATGVDSARVEENGKRVSLSNTTDAGQTEVELGDNARIPADFPKTVPIYPGAKLVAAVGMTDNGKRSHVVTLSTTAPAATVYEFYKQRLPSFGTLEEVNLGGVRMLTAKNAKGMKLEVMVTADGTQKSTIQLVTSAGS